MPSKFSLSFLSLLSTMAVSQAAAQAAPMANAGALKTKPAGLPAPKLEAGVTEADLKTVTGMEQSAFGHTFSDDPMDKRLGRLELFTLRARQSGSVADRISVLKPAMAQKHGGQNGTSAVGAHGAKTLGMNAKLSRLEQNIMKKSFPQLDESARLSQLEKKVFGNDFPKLAATDRIQRLQKTLGVGNEDMAASPMTPGFSQSYSFSGNINGVPFSMHSNGANNKFSDNSAMNRQLNEAFNQLHRQMQEMNGMNGMGSDMMSPFDFGQGLFPNMFPDMPRGFVMPKMGPGMDADILPSPNRPNNQKRLMPKQFQQSPFKDGIESDKDKLPPYLDPNSI